MDCPCSECDAHCPSVNDLVDHLRSFHAVPSVGGYRCKLCSRRFDFLRSFSKHLSDHGKNNDFAVIEINNFGDGNEIDMNDRDNGNIVVNENDILGGANEDDIVLNNGREFGNLNLTVENMAFSTSENALKFVSKLYSVTTMNRSDVDMIVSCTAQLVQSIVGSLRVKNAEFNEVRLQPYLEIAEKPFIGLETESQRFSALKLSKAYIPPSPFVIDYVPGMVGNFYQELGQIPLSGQCVPIRHVLKQFFELPGVLQAVLNNYERLTNTESPISNIVQGTLWKNHILPRYQGKIALPINTYFDDAEPDNALGSHAGSHKVGTIYYNCPVIPSQFLSLLKNIFVSGIFLSDDRNVVNGNHKVFHYLIKELQFLERRGIDVCVNGNVTRIYFPLVQLLGDNLGLNSVLGFAEGFTANFPCRICRMHLNLIRRMTTIPPEFNRTVENYAADVLTNNMGETGVFEECVFNQLWSYHVITSSSVDIFHDVLEGVAKYDVCQILYYLIFVREYLSLEAFHLSVNDFYYGPVEAGNRPPSDKLTKNAFVTDSLNLSGAEMLCLVRYLSEMIGHFIPENDLVWEFYLLLRDIVDIVFSFEFIPGVEEYLHVLVQEHNQKYMDLFHENLKPKFHHLLHYRDLMKLVGPLVHLSTIRWEAKHRILKQIARSTCSRVNLPFTIMVKIMLDFGFRILSGYGLVPECTFGKMFMAKKAEIDPDNMLRYFNLNVDRESFNVTSWVVVNGIHFTLGMVLHVDYDDNHPVFAKILHIVHDGALDSGQPSVFFVCTPLKTLYFNHHYHGFDVEECEGRNIMAVSIDEVLSPHALSIRTRHNGELSVTTRYRL